MKTLDRLFQKLVDMNKQPQVKRKVRSIGNYFASIFVGLITVTIGVSIFVGAARGVMPRARIFVKIIPL